MTMTVSFDPNSLKQIAALAGLHILLTPEVQAAMQKGGQMLADAARANQHWKNPTGTLENSIVPIQQSPFEVQVGSSVIYSRRRNWGFVGADSLGRYYHDLGAYFMEAAIQQQQQAILQLLDAAVAQVLGGL